MKIFEFCCSNVSKISVENPEKKTRKSLEFCFKKSVGTLATLGYKALTVNKSLIHYDIYVPISC